MLVHTLWIVVYAALGHEARDYIGIGSYWVQRSTVSKQIVIDPTYRYPTSRDETWGSHRGYDGQFSYYIALDPSHARYYMDSPSYRYSRILYPAAAWVLAAGQADLVPYSMVVVNWLAIAFGTLAIALLLRRRGVSPWWAAAYGLAPGMMLAMQRDLTEPLAYGLAAGGLLVLSGTGRRRHLIAGLVFALAALARQTTLLIPLVWALWTLLGWDGAVASARTRLRQAALVAGVAVGPYLAWEVYLRSWLGASSSGEPYVLVPFGWLFHKHFGLSRQPPMVIAVVVPAVLAAACAVWALRRGRRRPEWACLALQVLAFVIFAPAYNAYTSLGRVVLGIVLVAVLCIPFLRDLPARGRRAMGGAGALYMAMAPVIYVYGLSNFHL
jgi:hypothetical protein